MKMKKFRLPILGLALLFMLSSVVGCGSKTSNTNDTTAKKAETFPTKGISLVVPYAAGGGTDMVARILATQVEKELGQTVTVVNKPGGGSALGMLDVAQAKPDGYNLVIVAPPVVAMSRLGQSKISYKDLQPVIGVNNDYFALTVAKDAPWNTIQEFMDYAKKNPGKVQVGTTTPGGAWHTAAIALEDKTGIKLKIIPFEKGAPPAIAELLGGHLDAITVSVPEVAANVKGGKLKILAVAGNDRVEDFKDVPTFKESGIDVPAIGAYRGIMAPKGTPEEVVKKLHDAFKKAVDSKEVEDFLKKNIYGKMYLSTADWTKFLENEDKIFIELMEKNKDMK